MQVSNKIGILVLWHIKSSCSSYYQNQDIQVMIVPWYLFKKRRQPSHVKPQKFSRYMILIRTVSDKFIRDFPPIGQIYSEYNH